MIVTLLIEHHLEFLSLKGGFRGSSESTLVKMSNCLKAHATAHLITESTRITPTTATLTDHIYTTAQANIAENLVSDLSVCVTLRVTG